MQARLTLAILALAAVLPVHADCKWEWLCNGKGACKQMPVCDSVYDVAPPAPKMAPPTPPLSVRPDAITSNLPGLTCEPVMHQTPAGNWHWGEACFCSDAMRAADPSAPAANIVRCQPPWKEPGSPNPQPQQVPGAKRMAA